MKKMSAFAKIAAHVNRKSSGAAKGRKESDSKAKREEEKKKYKSKLKPGKVSKSKRRYGGEAVADRRMKKAGL